MNQESDVENLELAAQNRLVELGLQFGFDKLPYRLDKMFPKLKGWGAKGDIKKKVKLIQQMEPILPDVLLPDEEIYYVSKGIQHSILEAVTIGALWSSMINQTVFVLTNVRLVMFHTNTKGKPKETCWQIYYSEIKQFKKSFTSSVLKLDLNDGTKLQFTGFSNLDKKTMPQLFEETLETFKELGFQPECTQSRENLCGRCYQIVPKSEYMCKPCGTEFWQPNEVAIRSLVIPSWGDFLLGHNVLACFETFGFMVSWLIAISLLSNGEWGLALIVVAFAHGMDALVTYFIARKGLFPKTKKAIIQSEA